MVPTGNVVVGGIVAQVAMVSVWALDEFAQIKLPTEIAMAGAGILVTFVQYAMFSGRR